MMESSILLTLFFFVLLYFIGQQKKEITRLREGLSSIFNKLDTLEKSIKNKNSSSIPDEGSEVVASFDSEVILDNENDDENYVPDYIITEQIEEILANNNVSDTQEDSTIDTQINEEEELLEATEPLETISNNVNEPLEAQFEEVQVAEPTLDNWYQRFKENNPDIEKFIGENLINKIGIFILVLGISFFVKYAIDREWINEPGRVGIGMFCGVLLLGVAHRLRQQFKAFSSVLVAGAVSIFYFTIGIAYHDYHLFNQPTAFIIMILITVFAVLVSILYNRQELGVLSTIAGFAVPFMVSNGSGNYMGLLTYLSILNIGILIISYYKRWFIVNFTALIATLVIVGGWYTTLNEPPTQTLLVAFRFCTLFYLIFVIAFTINNIVYKNKFQNYELAALLLSSALYFSIGYNVINRINDSYLGLFTISLGVFNMIFAYTIYKFYKFDKNIIYVFIGLSLTLATITIPIQLDGNYVTLLWSCEAVLLFWLSKKSNLSSFTIGAIIVQLLAICSALFNLRYYNITAPASDVNSIFITNLFLLASLITAYRIIKNNNISIKINNEEHQLTDYTKIIFYLTLLLGYLFPIIEISYRCRIYFPDIDYNSYFFIYLYHMLYSTSILLYYKVKKNYISAVIQAMILLNVIIYMAVGFRLPIIELMDNLDLTSNNHLILILHYLTLALLLYQVYELYKVTFLASEKNRTIQSIVPWGFALFIVYFMSAETNIIFFSMANNPHELEIIRNQSLKIIFPILWGIIAFLFLIYGIKNNFKPVRIIGLILLAITIIKLFTYDIKDASETGKIIAFILLGVLILIISFIYQKIKKLVVDDNEK